MSEDKQPAPDAGNTEDMDRLTAPLDPDDDIEKRIALVNRERGHHLEDDPNSARS